MTASPAKTKFSHSSGYLYHLNGYLLSCIHSRIQDADFHFVRVCARIGFSPFLPSSLPVAKMNPMYPQSLESCILNPESYLLSTDIAQVKRLSQSFNWIAFGDEFVTDIKIIIGLGDCLHYRRVVDLLFVV